MCPAAMTLDIMNWFLILTPKALPIRTSNWHAKKLLITGFGGSILYRQEGINQYIQFEAFLRAYSLLACLIWNLIHYGRFLDIFITHSPAKPKAISTFWYSTISVIFHRTRVYLCNRLKMPRVNLSKNTINNRT